MVFAPLTLVGLILGAAVVFLFSGLAISAVGRAAGAVVFEVRRQFREIQGIMDGSGKPEYGKVVDICTRDSLRELATPGLLALMAPIAVGFGLGASALAGYLAGAIATGTLMAVFLANSGGAWDNAKKLVEDGHHGGKGSPAHEATVIGDTVGDPFKDTAGPAINPLIKVMNLVAVLIAPAVVAMSPLSETPSALRFLIAGVAVAVIVVAVTISTRRPVAIADSPSTPEITGPGEVGRGDRRAPAGDRVDQLSATSEQPTSACQPDLPDPVAHWPSDDEHPVRPVSTSDRLTIRSRIQRWPDIRRRSRRTGRRPRRRTRTGRSMPVKRSALPDGPRLYHQMLRGPRRRWWRPLVALLLLVPLAVPLMFAAIIPVVLLGVIQGVPDLGSYVASASTWTSSALPASSTSTSHSPC